MNAYEMNLGNMILFLYGLLLPIGVFYWPIWAFMTIVGMNPIVLAAALTHFGREWYRDSRAPLIESTEDRLKKLPKNTLIEFVLYGARAVDRLVEEKLSLQNRIISLDSQS